MKALKHKSYFGKWGHVLGTTILCNNTPTIFPDRVTVPDLILAFGFKAVEDYVLVNVKVEQI